MGHELVPDTNACIPLPSGRLSRSDSSSSDNNGSLFVANSESRIRKGKEGKCSVEPSNGCLAPGFNGSDTKNLSPQFMKERSLFFSSLQATGSLIRKSSPARQAKASLRFGDEGKKRHANTQLQAPKDLKEPVCASLCRCSSIRNDEADEKREMMMRLWSFSRR